MRQRGVTSRHIQGQALSAATAIDLRALMGIAMPRETPRITEVRRQFINRVNPEERTEEGVAQFYRWLMGNCPELLAVGKQGDDALAQLRKDLAGLYK